ncbi:MAG: hypothetical protein IT381_27705 [Deltaproteobacteria bacterium]|nr:hypothetical protein [Deltaproteobacteria bacterium]
MQTSPVYRTIDRPSRLFGLEVFDAALWATTFIAFKWWLLEAFVLVSLSWVALFVLRFRRPPRFLLSFVRFHAQRLLNGNRFSAAVREPAHEPWLSLRSPR